MEAKKEDFIITEKWLEEMGACEDRLQAFKKHFPNGGEASEVLRLCVELHELASGLWLVEKLPFDRRPLVRSHVDGHLLHNGNVHIIGDVVTQEITFVKGNLKIDGRLDLKYMGLVLANRVKVSEINLHDQACIEVKTRLKAKVINSKNSRIRGSVDADEIINDGGLIDGNVNTIRIKNINGGKVTGKITYKC